MKGYTLAIVGGFAISICPGSPAFADVPYFVALNHAPGGGSSTVPWDVSADGSVVVGKSILGGGYKAFRWTLPGGMVNLGELPGGASFSEALGVSNDGTTVVGQSDSASGREAFRWEGGTMVGLGDLPGADYFSMANGMSANGSVVVGEVHSSFGGGEEAFRWENGVMSGLGALPGGVSSFATGASATGSVIVGTSHTPQGFEAFRWENNVMTGLGFLPGDSRSEATDVSDEGSVIAGWGYTGAFRWVNGVMTPLGDLPGGSVSSFAWAVSGDGSVVVGQGESNLGVEAFIWDPAHGMRNFRTMLMNDFGLNLTGWRLRSATGVSADGLTFVGDGYNPSGQYEGWVAHIPEPSTVLSLVLGSLITFRRRRKWNTPGVAA